MRQIIPAHDTEVQEVVLNHRGDLLASVSWDGQIRFSNPWTGRVEIEFPRQSAGLMFSRDDTQLGWIVEPLGAGSGHALLEIQEGPVLRRVENSGHLTHAWTLTFSPDGRWLASAFGQSGGVRVHDVAGRQAAAALPECVGRTVLFEPNGRSLLITSPEGILRVPLSPVSQGTNLTGSFGPAQAVLPAREVALADLSRDGRWLAFTTHSHEGWLLDLMAPEAAVLLGQQRSALSVAVSPDGQWVASGNWHGYDGLWIWNTRPRAVVKRIPMALVRLNWRPDGRWVCAAGTTDGHAFQRLLVEAGSWQVRHETETLASAGHCACSPDSRLVAFISDGGGAIRLHEVRGFRQLATLEAPHQGQAVWLAFSPDGTRLAAQGCRQGIQFWDLSRLRPELKARGLDWEP